MSRVSSRQGWLFVVAAILAVSVGLCLSLRQDQVSGQDQTASVASRAATANPDGPAKSPEELKRDPVVGHANALSRAFRESAKVAMPSVVTVYSRETAKKVKSTRGESPFGG